MFFEKRASGRQISFRGEIAWISGPKISGPIQNPLRTLNVNAQRALLGLAFSSGGGEEGWWRRQLRGPGVRHGPVHWELRVKHVCTGGDVKASPELPLLAGG